ncbi:hypothetical protein [Providencia alcalifaciens]|uniref:hypothetical protein n=1 Tax=Providencia alcalifaciens TaxID=126385 RepID=UPI00044C0F27|nr:hypothetical protein [Providencia alcalifaciens]EUD07262.1 hypothetical protein HMPREF1564_3850 [Providencia alcalifaciens R90-1475]
MCILKKIPLIIAAIFIAASSSNAEDIRYEWQGGPATMLWDFDRGNTAESWGFKPPSTRTSSRSYKGYQCLFDLHSVPNACFIPHWTTVGRTPGVYYSGPVFFIPERSYGTPSFTVKRFAQFRQMLSEVQRRYPLDPPKPKGFLDVFPEVKMKESSATQYAVVRDGHVFIDRTEYTCVTDKGVSFSYSDSRDFLDVIPNQDTGGTQIFGKDSYPPGTKFEVRTKKLVPVGMTRCTVSIQWHSKE